MGGDCSENGVGFDDCYQPAKGPRRPMRWSDTFRFAATALGGARLRTGLMLVAMAIGVAAVVLLAALGDGARRYVTGQFSALGTHLLIVMPGRNETTGGAPPMLSETPRDLTLADAEALGRIPQVVRVAPLNVGEAPVAWHSREREVPIWGATAEMQQVRQMALGEGQFLPPGDPTRPASVAVIGAKVRDELFRGSAPLGEWIRIGDRRFRVIGVLAQKGQSLGVDIDELVVIPVASAQQLFNEGSLFRILVEARSRTEVATAQQVISQRLAELHEGEEDVTVVAQDSVLATFDRILGALTLAVAGIAAISLVVAGVLIMNVMLVAVTQRTSEIGLLKALGATPQRILTLFLAEAVLLSLLGALIGLALGEAGSWLLRLLYPSLPATPPTWSVVAGVGIALVAGLLFGTLPARRAARLDPVQALSRR